ncbi:hypothetical protein [Bacillus sp. AFS075034]|uniref:hypothetical protein n=1 Tax=Bacillus sp. AFS075034 TaxID=2034281 RepID=UPI000BF99228|nr:hypothetical protein [Bacillus sp. AFS075034]PFW63018.1 hypothetical protein COL20_10370 [Bacillus sp. AFS075034]
MANKRTRKKRETKEKRSFSILEIQSQKPNKRKTKEDIKKETKRVKKAKGKQLEQIYKKELTKKKNRDRQRGYKKEAEKWGLKNPSQYKSKEKLDKAIAAQKRKFAREQKKLDKQKESSNQRSGERLFIFWTDESGQNLDVYKDIEYQVDNIYNNGGEESLISHIRHYRGVPFGIPATHCHFEIAESKNQVKDLIEYFHAEGWLKIYEGKCKYWIPILRKIAEMMLALYDPEMKMQFIYNTASWVSRFNEKYANKIHTLFVEG